MLTISKKNPAQNIEPFIKNLLNSLDAPYISPTKSFPTVEAYALQFGSTLKRTCAIIINGQPIIASPHEDPKLQFQKKWLATPLSQHQLTGYDCHLIPGTGNMIINFSARVKFDQSGRTRLGESADLIHDNVGIARSSNTRAIWGSWFGVNATIIADESVVNNSEGEIINSLNYRFTYIPEDTIMSI